jgi:tripartite-type tricarboxylate transporter receptor subunit TctC
MPRLLRCSDLAIFGAVFLALSVLTCAAHGDVSFHGKTINIIINSAAGGGTDTIARLAGGALAKNLPGEPSLVFRNLPGGGGIQANNYFYSQVPPDGLTLLSGSRTQISPSQLHNGAVKYNPAEYRFVGGTERLGTIIVANKNRANLNNTSAEALVYGDVDGERSGLIAVLWAKEYMNWNVRFIVGYGGTSALSLAARRGEIDLIADSSVAHVIAMKDDGLLPIVQFGARDENDRRVARAVFPDLPIFDEMILPNLSGRALKAYKSWRDDQIVDKWLALPPKTPDEIVETYRAAYLKAAADPKVMDINRKTYGEDLPTFSGGAIDKVVRELVATEEEDLAFLLALKKKHGLPAN